MDRTLCNNTLMAFHSHYWEGILLCEIPSPFFHTFIFQATSVIEVILVFLLGFEAIANVAQIYICMYVHTLLQRLVLLVFIEILMCVHIVVLPYTFFYKCVL